MKATPYIAILIKTRIIQYKMAYNYQNLDSNTKQSL